MSKLMVSGRVDSSAAARMEEEETPNGAAEWRPTRLARMLALAYLVERSIDDMSVRDYADAARLIGVSRARMTQIMDLACLPPQEQEDILLGRTITSERSCRRHL